ncbi:MAG: nicotinate-nicotinamide nucleotide adenylyltransferase, partial [Rubrivivax sp.]
MFGGAFDPPHRAHRALAETALDQLDLDVLHILPTGQAWHKSRTLTPARDRVAMCQLAFGDLPRLVLDEREIHREGPSYTADTLSELQ